MDNTPFARWKKALPSLPLSKSIDSDDRKTIAGDETVEPQKTVKKKGKLKEKYILKGYYYFSTITQKSSSYVIPRRC